MNAFTVQDAPLNMAPTGIATFAKVPICYDIHHANADMLFWARHLIWRFREKQDVALDRVESAMHLPASA